MAKRVSLNGVEIYSPAENIPTDHFFDFVQEVVDSLEAALASEGRDLHLKLQFRFYTDQNPKHHIHFNGLKNRRIKEKVVKVVRRSTKVFKKETTGNIKIDILVQDK